MQISLFDEMLVFPASFSDIQGLWEKHICEGETDDDAFTKSEIKDGYSYSFYGVKAFEFVMLGERGSKLRLPDDIMKALFPHKEGLKEGQFYSVKDLSSAEMLRLVELLKIRKRRTFRNTITETFACCNSYLQCSDARACLHANDRNYNGCYYRMNLEEGRIFYGKNRNVE